MRRQVSVHVIEDAVKVLVVDAVETIGEGELVKIELCSSLDGRRQATALGRSRDAACP
jgi:hypothetical protein